MSADLIDLWGGLKHVIGLLRLLTQLQLTDTAVSCSLTLTRSLHQLKNGKGKDPWVCSRLRFGTWLDENPS